MALFTCWVIFLLPPAPALAETPRTELAPVRIHGATAPEMGAFDGIPLSAQPISARILSLENTDGSQAPPSLRDLARQEASVTDSYNAAGYWDSLAIRGLELDSRTGYLRDGLPLFAETWVPFENKSELQVFKGLSALQAGVGSPAGLVNLVTKRPERKPFARPFFGTQAGDSGALSTQIAIDANRPAGATGLRLNLAAGHLNASADNTQGRQAMAALAADRVLEGGARLFAEIEAGERSQPSRAAFSLHGDRLPGVPDPKLNYNSQSWSQLVIFKGQTASLGAEWEPLPGWEARLRLMEQRLQTDDRAAYGAGCASEGRSDRFCQDGSFDLYDYRSEGEHRTNRAGLLSLSAELGGSALKHRLTLSLIAQHLEEDLVPKADNPAGVQDANGTRALPEAPALTSPGTNRASRKWDLTLSDRLSSGNWSLWLGARHSWIHRESARTDGSRALGYDDRMLLPWAALSREQADWMGYLSYGEGLDSFVTPQKSSYTNPGEPLRDVRSRQWELGAKSPDETWSIALFEARRAAVSDLAPAYEIDGEEVFQGLESGWRYRRGPWEPFGSLLWMKAERQGSKLRPELNSKTPSNIPAGSLRWGLAYWIQERFRAEGAVISEGPRDITSDGTQELPAWTRLDAGLSGRGTLLESAVLWRVNVENIFDQRYWRESPTRYDHLYLYPGRERTFTVSLTASL